MTQITAVPVHIRAKPSHRLTSVMPVSGPLIDSYGRVHTDLRLSVTDECNLRCVYCLPETGARFVPHTKLLTVDELVRVARIAHDLGVTSLRLTGGEPLLRKEIVSITEQLAAIGFADLSLTTNGMRLAKLARSLVDAGLQRINVSCDSLRVTRFEAIRRRGDLATVLHAMDVAEAAGLDPIKVNVVVMRGVNDDEIVDFAGFARRTGRIVRFIEFMPLDADDAWDRSQVVPGDEIIATINETWPLVAKDRGDDPAPADRFIFADGGGEVGVITSVTNAFCGTCDRLRVTADGAVRNCLFARDESSVRDLMRDGATDEQIARLLRDVTWAKLPGHGIDEPGFLRPKRSMSMIGG